MVNGHHVVCIGPTTAVNPCLPFRAQLPEPACVLLGTPCCSMLPFPLMHRLGCHATCTCLNASNLLVLCCECGTPDPARCNPLKASVASLTTGSIPCVARNSKQATHWESSRVAARRPPAYMPTLVPGPAGPCCCLTRSGLTSPLPHTAASHPLKAGVLKLLLQPAGLLRHARRLRRVCKSSRRRCSFFLVYIFISFSRRCSAELGSRA